MDRQAFSDLYRRLIRALRPPPKDAEAMRLRVLTAPGPEQPTQPDWRERNE